MSERFLPYQLHTQQSVKYNNKEGIEDTNNDIAIKKNKTSEQKSHPKYFILCILKIYLKPAEWFFY